MRHRPDERGQVIVLTALAMVAAVVFIAVVVNTGDAVAAKVRLQGAADAAAYSGAVMQARGLNVLAALNWYLTAVDRFYTAAIGSWLGAVAAAAASDNPAPIEAWLRTIGKVARQVCDPKALAKIKETQERIVHGFNRGPTSPAVIEAREIGQANSEPLPLASPFQFSFQARHWALNFDGQGGRGTSRTMLPELPVVLGLPRMPRRGAADIECAIPPTWRLAPDYRRTAYVFTAAATKPMPTLVGGNLFGPPRPSAAVAEARPVHNAQTDLELLRPDWRATLVRVEPSVMARFRRSSVGGYLSDFPAAADPLLRH